MEMFLGAAVLTAISARDSISTDRFLYVDRYKRWLDFTVAALALLLCLPLLLIISLLVCTTSPGPAFFVQKRVGQYGQLFDIYKFRTMTDSGSNGDCTTGINDPRITGLGRFLRNTKIDELPQLLNILKGDMSIIGPRPLSAIETEHIESTGVDGACPGFFHLVRPGLIGLEQMNRKQRLDYRSRFQFNRQYERELTFGLDCYIFVVSFFQCRFVCSLAMLSAILELFFLVLIQ